MVPDKMSPTKNGPQLLECELEFSKVWSRAGAENGEEWSLWNLSVELSVESSP